MVSNKRNIHRFSIFSVMGGRALDIINFLIQKSYFVDQNVGARLLDHQVLPSKPVPPIALGVIELEPQPK
jgi:hypothetical protein